MRQGWNITRAVTRIPLKSSVNRQYIYRHLQSPAVQGYFQKETRAVAQPTLNVGLIAKTPIALPPAEYQNDFLRGAEAIFKLKRKYQVTEQESVHLLNSLSQRSFRGGLSSVSSLWRKARRENSAASRLPGTTSLRFALHGWQRMKPKTLCASTSLW